MHIKGLYFYIRQNNEEYCFNVYVSHFFLKRLKETEHFIIYFLLRLDIEKQNKKS